MTTKKPKKPADNLSVHLTVRLHADLVARIDALVPVFAASSTLAPTGVAGRADVLRAALEAGLSVVEQQHKP